MLVANLESDSNSQPSGTLPFELRFSSGDGFLKIIDPGILGPKYLTIEMQGQYYQEDEPRNVHHFVSRKQARKLIKRLKRFVQGEQPKYRKGDQNEVH